MISQAPALVPLDLFLTDLPSLGRARGHARSPSTVTGPVDVDADVVEPEGKALAASWRIEGASH